MSDLQFTLTFFVFAAVILAIVLNLMDTVVAALLGVSAMLVFGAFTRQEFMNAVQTAGTTIALLFGGMVVARTLEPTGIFELIGVRFLRATGGSGKRFLLGLIVLVAPVSAFLPNPTTVLLLAPIIIRVAVALKVEIAGPLILAAIISNTAGLLTLVGDSATFLVGDSIGMSFGQYLKRVSIGGIISILTLIPLLPLMMRHIWRVQEPIDADIPHKPLERPVFCLLSLFVLAVMILLFLFGDLLPFKLVPPSVAIVCASLALLVIFGAKVEPIDNVLKDVDWKTLIFLSCMFLMVEALTRTGIQYGLSKNLVTWFGKDVLAVGLVMLAGVGAVSSVLANTPLVAAMVLLVKGYFVGAELVPEIALGPAFTEWPVLTLPVFVAMLFGATLGGNATLIGASANLVSAGISRSHGRPISFGTFARYGIPMAICQMIVSAVYVLALHWLITH